MYINMMELKNLVHKRQSGKKYVGLPFGSAVKYKRKEKNLTLEEACEGICSLSYLSKVENNNISASEEFIEKFKKKFDMKDAYDYDKDSFKIHIDQIIEACLKDKKIDHNMLTYYDDRLDYQSLLVDFAYNVLDKNYEQAQTAYKNLSELIYSMPQEPFMVTMILINHILYYEMRYTDGLELLSMVERQQPYSNEISLLIQKWKLLHGFKINNPLLVSNLYQPYEKILIKKQLFEQVKITHMEHLLYKARFSSIEQMKNEISGINNIDEADKEYLMSVCHYHRGNYDKTLSITSKYAEQSQKWMAIHLISLDHLKEEKRIFDAIEKEVINKNPLCKLLKKHLMLKYKGTQEEIVNYIKQDILIQDLCTEDYDILIYLMKDCERLLTKFHFYKDAVSVYRHFLSKLYKISFT
ncbi:MAG: helix-turn-helix transcriptional regulator [Acholeplasmataceae bacterium]